MGFRGPKTRKIAAGSLLRSPRLMTGAVVGAPKSSSAGVPATSGLRRSNNRNRRRGGGAGDGG